MRVLIAATSLNPAYGGPAYSVSRLATALAWTGATVGLWVADGSAPEAGDAAPLQGPLRDAFGAFAPDVAHDNGLWRPHNHRVAELARETGVPRVVSVRGMLEPWAVRHKRWKKAAAWRLYQRRDLDRAAALHATSAEEAANLHAFALRPPIRTIANGVDLPDLSTSPGDGAETRTALFLGRIYPIKGLPMLIEAWARVRPAGWRLVIAGPDEAGHQREVEAMVAAHGLGAVVSFPGPVAGAAKTVLLASADLVVAPSLSESFGMAIAEALAHAKPVLTTTAAPWPALETRRCGWRVAPTVEAFTAALGRATACDRATLRMMGAAGRDLVAAEYGWPAIADAFLALYDELARRGERAPAAA